VGDANPGDSYGIASVGHPLRDVKTDSVLINDDGDAVVLDFGEGNTIDRVLGQQEGSYRDQRVS
jgi:hypothetical protein